LFAEKEKLMIFLERMKGDFFRANQRLNAGAQYMKRQKRAKAKNAFGPAKKPLSVRYAEVLRLRQMIQETLSQTNSPIDRRISGRARAS
jgi:hypothetical protein